MLTPDEVRSIVKSEQSRRQLARSHHRRKNDLAAIIDSPAGNGDTLDFAGHYSLQ